MVSGSPERTPFPAPRRKSYPSARLLAARMHVDDEGAARDLPVFPRNSLVSCEACGEVFINWTRSGTHCRACGSLRLREIRWRPAGGGPRRPA